MNTVKMCFIDIETTGLDPVKNGILEIGGIIVVGETVEEFNYFAKPFPQDKIVQSALATNKIKMKDANEFPNPLDVHRALSDLFSSYINKYDPEDKFIFIAYNAPFDYGFLRSFFKKCGDKYFGSYFHYPPLDVMQMALMYLIHVRHKMPNFRLFTVARELGIPMDEKLAHGAMYDISITREMFKVMEEEKDDGA